MSYSVSDIQQVIMDVLSKVLNATDLQLSDNFFAKGGNSLAAVIAISEIATRLNMAVPISAFFTVGTIGDLANSLIHDSAVGDDMPVRLHGTI